MKQLRFCLLILAISLAFTSCDDDDYDYGYEIDFSELPPAARSFLNTFYPISQISYIGYDDSDYDAYEVEFYDGSEVDFDYAGNWVEVSAPYGFSIPQGIAPAYIENDVYTYYPGLGINSISISRSMIYYVELTNGIELTYN